MKNGAIVKQSLQVINCDASELKMGNSVAIAESFMNKEKHDLKQKRRVSE